MTSPGDSGRRPADESRPASRGVRATAETEVVAVHLEVTAEVANDLYRLQGKCGFPDLGWRGAYPALFDLYDALNEAGVDGTR